MKNRFAVPIPLPHEADGLVSLFVGFHGTNNSGLLAILSTRSRQLIPGPASGDGNYVFVKGFAAYSTISEDAQRQTVRKLGASSQEYARRAASMHVGSS